jgi:hypothetical protein
MQWWSISIMLHAQLDNNNFLAGLNNFLGMSNITDMRSWITKISLQGAN